MKYSIKVNEVKNPEGNIRGFASVTFGDALKVTNIAILENRERGEVFVSMPRYKSSEKDERGEVVYKDVCNPITKEFREELYGNILEAFGRVQESKNETMVVNKDSKEMPDISVAVVSYEREGSSIKGLARVYVDKNFVVSNVSILQGKNGAFVAMPSYKTKQVDETGKAIYQDLCYPVTKEFREKLYGEVLEKYQEEKEKSKEELKSHMEQAAENKQEWEPAQDTPFR
ncbi:DNA-binding protein SpoVG, cell septation regulator [Lachnospiraceae bacterium XBB1006]|nr:DNA-binding protein SpoVG, cell septation regulator [Lachnospiraceae bacterium XBB1006]